jgi:predicted transcriptional regulator/ribosomal protein S27E
MKYSFETQEKILELKNQGHSSRTIGAILGISKSGVNNFLNSQNKSKAGAKILFIDLETSAALAYCFGRHKVFLNQDSIHTEGGKILVAGYRWLGEEKSTVVYNKSEIRASQDYFLCLLLWDLFNKADVVVAHNAKNFDVKMLEVRCLANGLPPLPTVQVIDTLEIAKKKFRFPSNKLDSLAAYLGIGRKVVHSGIDLWVKVQQGNEKALADMVEYCEGDVDLLVEVFLALRSRGFVSGFNAALYYDDDLMHCRSCGSTFLEYTGRKVMTPSGIYNEIRCNDCGTIQRDKVNQTSKSKRAKLLSAPKAS